MKTQATYKIEKRIPISTISRTARIRNTLAEIGVGESFLIPKRDFGKATDPRFIVPYREARQARIRINWQLLPAGLRIWRVR